MKILVVGASGMIGKAVVHALAGRHTVIAASLKNSAVNVDISDPSSIKNMYKSVGKVDAVVSAAGEGRFKPLPLLTDDDFAFSVKSKLMGQVNLVRYGIDFVSDNGSFTLTSGVLAQKPAPGSVALGLVGGALESFVRAMALELPRGLRINIVSPGWVAETLQQMGKDPAQGTPAVYVGLAYARSVETALTGSIITPWIPSEGRDTW